MKKTNINYPHPVLSGANEDYVNCGFDISLIDDPTINGDVAIINLSYSLICDGLKKLIDMDCASVTLYLESVASEYRNIFRFDIDKTTISITINKNYLSNNLQIRGYIVANTEMRAFSLPEHNKEVLGDIPYEVRPGDILAISEHFFSIPLDTYDPLADRPSIFSIRRQPDEGSQKEISVDFLSHPKITIYLGKELFEVYRKLYDAPEARMFLASFFATPVLVDVLSFIKNASEDEKESLTNLKWYQVLQARLKELKIELSEEISLTYVANSVLPHVFKSNIEQFTKVFSNIMG